MIIMVSGLVLDIPGLVLDLGVGIGQVVTLVLP